VNIINLGKLRIGLMRSKYIYEDKKLIFVLKDHS
jgi:hypothetical protein